MESIVMNMGVCVGVAIEAALGIAIGQIGRWVSVGNAAGLVVWSSADVMRREKQKTIRSKTDLGD